MKIMAWQPTVKQAKFVDALLAGKNITQSAEYAGCTKQAWYGRWRHDDSFLGYLEGRRSEQATVRLPAVDKALFDKAVSGDIQATRLVYEVFGHLRTNAPRVVQVHNEHYDFSGLSKKELQKQALDLAQDLQNMAGRHIGELEPVVQPDDDAEGAQEGPNSRFSEAERRRIFNEIVGAEDRAAREAVSAADGKIYGRGHG